MKALILTFCFCLSMTSIGLCQLVIDGASLFVGTSTSLKTTLDLVNTNSGAIINEGTIVTESLDNNSGATINGNGTYEVNNDWINTSTFIAGSSTVEFKGSVSGNITAGGAPMFNMILNKLSGNDVNLIDNLTIQNTLTFNSDNNKINLGNQDLSMGASANITGHDESDYVVTGGTGKLVKDGLGVTAFTFPVGFDNLTYNPVTIGNAGTTDGIGVRVLEKILDEGNSGNPIMAYGVDAAWDITEEILGGSNLTLTPQWTGTDELPGFDRTNCEVLRFIAPFWELDGGTFGPATPIAPFSKTKTGINNVGTFAIGHEFLVVNIKIAIDALLDGPSGGNPIMSDALRANGLLPTSEPYTGMGYTHIAPGGGEMVDPGVLLVTGNDAIVDWIIVELRSGIDNTNIVASRAALIQRDGDIVDLDGINDLIINGVSSGEYYVAVRHRNHLGAVTLSPVTLSRTSNTVDFRNGTTPTFGIHAQKNNSGLMTLWAGDADGDKRVIYAGPGNDPSQVFVDVLLAPGNAAFNPNFLYTGYLNSDLNMDGTAIYAGPNNDVNTIFFEIFLHPNNLGFDGNFIIDEQIPE